MTTNGTIGLIGSLGVLALVLLGLVLLVRGLVFGPSRRSSAPTAPVGFGRGVLGRTVSSLLSFAVAYKFFFEGYAGSLYGFESMLGMAAFTILAMTLLPAVETLVAISALTVFLIQNTATFGHATLGTFVGLLLVFALFRWFLGR